MKKIILITLCLLTISITSQRLNAQEIPPTGIYVQKGTFIKAITPIEISTSDSDIGDDVYFINTSDMYIKNTNAIPRGSKLIGKIEDIREPVQGTNAAIKIRIDTIITPEKREIPTNAYLFGDSNNYIGGEMTPPAYYHRMPHYTEGLKGGVLQYTPSNIRSFGEHKIIKAGSEVFIILNDDLKI